MRHYSLKAVMEVKKKFSIHISRPILHLLRPYFLQAKVQTMIKVYLFTPVQSGTEPMQMKMLIILVVEKTSER